MMRLCHKALPVNLDNIRGGRLRLVAFVREMLVLTVRQARRRGGLVAALVAMSVGGCSYVPDAANPVEWYKGTRDWINGADKVEAAKQPDAKPIPGADKSFPKLYSVPKRPRSTTRAERQKMANTLIADRNSARYSDEQFRRQNSSIGAGTLPPSASAPPVAPPRQLAARQVVSSRASAPPAIPARSNVVATNQPVPVIPNQPVAVQPVSRSVGLPRSSQPVQMRFVPSVPPPPPPVLADRSAPPSSSPPTGSVNDPEWAPMGQPSVGGPVSGRPALPVQRGGVFVNANRFATRFPNEVSLPRQPPFVTKSTLANSTLVATIGFANGSARIGGRDRQIIRQVYKNYRTHGGRIHVIGHSSSRTRNLDQVSHQLVNFSISCARARSVAQVLEQLGVPPEAIVVQAMSDKQPAFIEVMPAGEAGNRRAVIYFEN